MKRIWIMALLITGIILLDQFTKGIVQSSFMHGESINVISGFFNLTYVKNPGAAFGFGAYGPTLMRQLLFLLVPVIACVWLIYLIFSTRHQKLILCLAYSLILAGAVGNLIDRFSMGYVVDFLDFYIGTHHFPAFNVADSSISIAAGLLIYDYFEVMFKEKKQS